jgi:hypothetical protein
MGADGTKPQLMMSANQYLAELEQLGDVGRIKECCILEVEHDVEVLASLNRLEDTIHVIRELGIVSQLHQKNIL